MIKFFKFLKRVKGHLLRILIFLLSIGIIIYIFPSERKFRYEFQKGKPWQHDNLIAPFDFSIYKLPEEIKSEEDSLKKDFKPYFDYDEEITEIQINLLEVKYIESWKQYLQLDSLLRKSDAEYRKKKMPSKKDYDIIFAKLLTDFIFIFDIGILNPTEILENIEQKEFSIVINKANTPQAYDYSQIFTEKIAYDYLMNNLKNYIAEDNADKLSFFKDMNLNQFLEPNLFYNKIMTDELYNSALDDISATTGFIQGGESIILKGELVDDEYRVLVSLKKEYEKTVGLAGNSSIVISGQILVIMLSLIVLVFFVYNYKPEILNSTRQSILILLLIVVFVVISAIFIEYNLANIYIIPFALLAIIIKVFFDARLALFVHLITIFIVGFIAPNGYEFVLLHFISGFAAIFSLTTLSRRGQLYISSAGVFVALSLLYLGIAMTQEGDFKNIKWIYFAYFAGNSLLLLSAYPLIYAFERIFGFISDVTLLELSNTNHPLLQILAKKAPGTFQHSLQVANLAEAAAVKIKANPLLVRAGALYHDIGKSASPIFFIENQIANINPHDKIDFDKSAKIITNHVPEGVKIAKKYKIPQQIIDFIRTHHGVSVVQYFYRSYIKKYPDKEVDINKFAYTGPRPFSKEMAIVMMADSIEAAARSIKEINKQKINDLVENIIDYQIREKMFINSDITFKEISFVKSLFKKMLINIYHARIEYPK